jgi:hypothetical protein
MLFYILSITLVIVAKPSLLFESNGDIKSFGVGSTRDDRPKTVFSLGVAVVVSAVLSFYLFAVLDVIFSPNKTV